jgi:Cu+-exporting ATPase
MAAAEAMFIVLVGEGLESYAAGRTEAAISKFVEQIPRRARVLRDGKELEVDAAALLVGDLIVVRAGERIGADGVVDDGISSVNESSITGEPLPREKQAGDEVFSGSLNGGGLLKIRVTGSGDNTVIARVAKLVEEAKEQRAPVERLADRVAKYFLPGLLLAAGLTFWFTRDWLRTVAVLVVACPCALILATPTAMVAAIGGLARRGILVRGAAVLQRAALVDTVAFDKTGTITEGQFEIIRIIGIGRGEEDVLSLAASAEHASDHPLAKIIVARAGNSFTVPRHAKVLPGRGAECDREGRTVRAGNAAYLAEAGVHGTEPVLAEADRLGATAVLVAEDDVLAGAILLRDRLRQGIREAVEGLEQGGVTELLMLTGDRTRAAEVIAREAGIERVEAELLPDQKAAAIRELSGRGRHVAMIGDGINDAPALAGAAVGIAVSGASDITAEAADVIFLPHDLTRLPEFFRVSRRAVKTAWQNIILFAGVVNIAAIVCAATGVIGPVGAALTHQLSSFFVMMNSLRLLRTGQFEARVRAKLEHWIGQTPLPRLVSRWPEVMPALTGLWERRREFARPAIYALCGLAVLNGFYIIRPDEVGMVLRFGARVLPYSEPGLHYKWPWPIDRLTRIQSKRVRRLEIGFRSNAGPQEAEPAAYEWNVQHRSGRFVRKPEESLMLTGDQNMIELNATIHYDLPKPDDYLFRQIDGEATIRAAAEAALESVVTSSGLDNVLTTGRIDLERRALADLQLRLDRYQSGIRALSLRLEDVHPSIEVVDAFRDVSGAYEEKNRLVNEAEGYRNEQVALARGNARANLEGANGYNADRINRALGDAARFDQRQAAYLTAPGPTETRLYLETIESVLPGKKKLIVDHSKARRSLYLFEDGVELRGGPGTPLMPSPVPTPAAREPEE